MTRRLYNPWAGFAMVLPVIVLLGVFALYPIAHSLIISFHEWPGIGEMEFAGVANYVRAVRDPIARLAFANNVVYTIGIIVLGVFPGLVLANLLAQDVRGRTVFQTIYFFPRLLSQVIVALVWGWIYNPLFGLVNKALRAVGLDAWALGWLGNADFAMYAVIVAAAWTYYGFCMVVFLAALRNTDPTLNDAAIMDGANGVQIFFYVTLPQIASVIMMVVIYTVIDSFKVFDIIFAMTSGGPGNRTQIMATYIYRVSFRHAEFGYGATISVFLTVFVLGVALSFNWIQGRRNR